MTYENKLHHIWIHSVVVLWLYKLMLVFLLYNKNFSWLILVVYVFMTVDICLRSNSLIYILWYKLVRSYILYYQWNKILVFQFFFFVCYYFRKLIYNFLSLFYFFVSYIFLFHSIVLIIFSIFFNDSFFLFFFNISLCLLFFLVPSALPLPWNDTFANLGCISRSPIILRISFLWLKNLHKLAVKRSWSRLVMWLTKCTKIFNQWPELTS